MLDGLSISKHLIRLLPCFFFAALGVSVRRHHEAELPLVVIRIIWIAKFHPLELLALLLQFQIQALIKHVIFIFRWLNYGHGNYFVSALRTSL